ncbi:MAG: hypothetical protein QOD84_2950 [Acidobacteriaceae bacterium]|jgi:hypothetical protein
MSTIGEGSRKVRLSHSRASVRLMPITASKRERFSDAKSSYLW